MSMQIIKPMKTYSIIDKAKQAQKKNTLENTCFMFLNSLPTLASCHNAFLFVQMPRYSFDSWISYYNGKGNNSIFVNTFSFTIMPS